MRYTATYNASGDGNRDAGKTYIITEMPAVQGEKWAIRALMALAAAGIDFPEEIDVETDGGMAMLAAVALQALGNISWQTAEPLLDELLGCVQFLPQGEAKPELARSLSSTIEGDVEEIDTLLNLRKEALLLHTGFLQRVARSRRTSEPTPHQNAA